MEVSIDEQFLDEDFEGDNREHTFDFFEIPYFVTVFIGVSAEPFFFLKVVEKGISDETFTDTWGRVILPAVRLL